MPQPCGPNHTAPTMRCYCLTVTCTLMQNWPEDEDNAVEFRYLCGNVDHSGALEEAGVTEADAIIIGPADDLPDNEVCMQTLHAMQSVFRCSAWYTVEGCSCWKSVVEV